MNLRTFARVAIVLIAASGFTLPAQAAEKKIGKPVAKHGMSIAAVYLQPVKMQPAMAMKKRADVHLEADVSALKGNRHGLSEGAWVPYLTVAYHIAKADGSWSATGSFMPMVANDGPHYGANVALAGPGKYRLTYSFQPPIQAGLFRHVDKETGIAAWWPPFSITWEFTYLGVGKKGTY
ncbi:MAG: iron transporter [Alphaproteobacteria bacterium]|nr:iron transporter [Alphaproteobacteria bacterium]